ncbi:MAG: zinc-ribbon domain-containing protein, partial [Huintestinicola sp.]
MKCQKCGFDNKDGSKFCLKCGNRLAEEVQSEICFEEQNIPD